MVPKKIILGADTINDKIASQKLLEESEHNINDFVSEYIALVHLM